MLAEYADFHFQAEEKLQEEVIFLPYKVLARDRKVCYIIFNNYVKC